MVDWLRGKEDGRWVPSSPCYQALPIKAIANLIPGANATESIAPAIPYKEEFFKLAEAEIQVAEIQRSYKPLDMRLVVRRSRGSRV